MKIHHFQAAEQQTLTCPSGIIPKQAEYAVADLS